MPPDRMLPTSRARGGEQRDDRNTSRAGCAGTLVVHHLTLTLSIGGFLALVVLGVLLVSPQVAPVVPGILLAVMPAASRSRLHYRYLRSS